MRALTALPDAARAAFRARVSGDPTGAPDWVRDIARVGDGPGWFEPDGVVWRVHGDLSRRFGPRWADTYVAEWARSAEALGARDLPSSRTGLAEALAELGPDLEPVPAHLLRFLAAPTGLGRTEQLFYSGLSAAGGLLLSPTIAGFAGLPGRDVRGPRQRAVLARTRWQLRGLQLALGPYSPSEDAARYRLGLAPAPPWLADTAALSGR